MSISQKIKAINNKIAQYKAQYDLGRQTAKMFSSSLEMLVNMNFLQAKMFFPEKDLLEKVAAMKRLEYSPLGKELKAQADMAEKQNQKFDNTYDSEKIIKKETPTLKRYNR